MTVYERIRIPNLKWNQEVSGRYFFNIEDDYLRIIATSCSFRNEAWCRINLNRITDILSAPVMTNSDSQKQDRIQIKTDNQGEYFEFITFSDKVLLSSIHFPTHEQCEEALRQTRCVLNKINQEDLKKPRG